MQIKDHIYYVTGGASGLGESTARKLHSLGAYVGVLDLNLSAAQSVADSLNQRGFDEEAVGERGAVGSVGAVGGKREGAGGEGGKGGKGGKRAHGIKCDVTSEEDVIKAIEELDRIWKGVNVGGVVNCGGVAMAGKTINQDGEPFDLDTFRTVVEINLVGTFNVSRLVAARLVRDVPKPIAAPDSSTLDRGVIINTASAAGLEGQAGQAAYGSSKAGVIGLGLPMARDLAWYGIRVMTLAPALFNTPMMERLPERAKARILKSAEFPMRFGHPEEFAQAVVACIQNGILNGSVVRLDGATRLGKL